MQLEHFQKMAAAIILINGISNNVISMFNRLSRPRHTHTHGPLKPLPSPSSSPTLSSSHPDILFFFEVNAGVVVVISSVLFLEYLREAGIGVKTLFLPSLLSSSVPSSVVALPPSP